MIGGAGFYQLVLSAFPGFKINFRDVADTTDLDVYTSEDKTGATSQIVADSNGIAYCYGDNTYRLEIVTSGDVPIAIFPEVQITKKKATHFGEDVGYGVSLPAAPDEHNRFHMFLLVDALSAPDYNVTGLYYCDGNTPSYKTVFDKDSDTGAFKMEDIMIKDTWCDIRWFGCTTASSDCSTEFQNAVTYCKDNGLALYIPWGAWKVKNIVGYDNLRIFGNGFGSILMLPATASGADTMFTFSTKVSYQFYGITLDGGNVGNDYILRLSKTSGSFTNVVLDTVRFQNHQGTALRVTGTAGSNFDSIQLKNCQFEELDQAVSMQYARPTITGCTFNNINKTTAGKPIFLDDCVGGIVSENKLNAWGSLVAGIHLTDCTYMNIENNQAMGTEAWGILTDTSAASCNYNTIVGNNVSGGHTTSALVSYGSNDIVDLNMGSSVRKNGTSGSTTTDNSAWNYVKISGTSTLDPPAANGYLEDAQIMPDIVAPQTDPVTKYDFIRFPNWAINKNMLYPIRSFVSGLEDSTVQLGNSDVHDSIDTVPLGEVWDSYPNILDTLIWEATPFWTTTILVSGTGWFSDSVIVTGDGLEGLLRLEIYANNSADANATNATQFSYDGIAYKDIVVDVDLSGTNLVGTVYFVKASGAKTLNVRISDNFAPYNSHITVRLYRQQRSIDQ